MSKTEVRDGRRQGQEWARLQAARNNGTAVAEVGSVSERAPVGNGPRGLQRRRQRVGLLHATIRRARAPITGARTDWPAFPTTRSSSVLRSRCGTATIRFSRSVSSA